MAHSPHRNPHQFPNDSHDPDGHDAANFHLCRNARRNSNNDRNNDGNRHIHTYLAAPSRTGRHSNTPSYSASPVFPNTAPRSNAITCTHDHPDSRWGHGHSDNPRQSISAISGVADTYPAIHADTHARSKPYPAIHADTHARSKPYPAIHADTDNSFRIAPAPSPVGRIAGEERTLGIASTGWLRPPGFAKTGKLERLLNN
jgi:hypothetical protein